MGGSFPGDHQLPDIMTDTILVNSARSWIITRCMATTRARASCRAAIAGDGAVCDAVQIAVIEAARQMQAQAERVRDEAQAETARLLVIETYTKKE
jgi:ribosomal silencing factor RsfS